MEYSTQDKELAKKISLEVREIGGVREKSARILQLLEEEKERISRLTKELIGLREAFRYILGGDSVVAQYALAQDICSFLEEAASQPILELNGKS